MATPSDAASGPAAHTSPSAEEMLEAYRLKPPASAAKKKPKLRQPRDCSQTVAAAKKKAKAREAAAAKSKYGLTKTNENVGREL